MESPAFQPGAGGGSNPNPFVNLYDRQQGAMLEALRARLPIAPLEPQGLGIQQSPLSSGSPGGQGSVPSPSQNVPSLQLPPQVQQQLRQMLLSQMPNEQRLGMLAQLVGMTPMDFADILKNIMTPTKGGGPQMVGGVPGF